MLRILLLSLVILVFASGCAVLTPSQINEANRFSKASTALSEMPGHVIEEHAQLRATVKTANASESSSGEKAWDLMKRGMELEDALQKKAERVDKACGILKIYGEMLVLLTSDTATKNLQGSADEIGDELDSALDSFNESYDRNIDTIGGEVAGMVRGLGGFYIKRKQTQALKSAVTQGQPIVDELSKEIIAFLELYVESDSNLSLIPTEKEQLIGWYKATGYKEEWPTSQLVRKKVRHAEAAAEYAQKALNATIKMQDAHRQLAEKLASKKTLKGTIELVEVYVDEVKDAKDLYDKFSD